MTDTQEQTTEDVGQEISDTQVPDFLSMSDDELLNYNPSQLTQQIEGTSLDGSEAIEDESDEEEDKEEEGEVSDSDETDAQEEEEDGESDLEEGEEPSEGESELEGEPTEMEKLLAPFKANGREMKVDSVEEARQLMQMGANYNKKMAAMKPGMKVLKMLENNGLMEESKINYLIDLQNKNPEAIAKLVKDSGIDPLDIGEGKEDYRPTDHTIPEGQIELDDVISSLQETDTGKTTLKVVNEWDAQSAQVLAANPSAIQLIHQQVENGIYDDVSKEVAKRRMLGKLEHVSDLNAYQSVGQEMAQAGKFNHLVPQQAKPKTESTATKSAPVLKEDVVKEKVRKSRKRAASPTKSRGKVSTVPDYNPLELSDEEFSKLNPKFI